MSGSLGVTDTPPVERIDWSLEVQSDSAPDMLDELKHAADEHCPGVYCTRNAIGLGTRDRAGDARSDTG